MPGQGWSSPVIAGDRVWLTTAEDAERGGDVVLRAIAFDLASGKIAVNAELFRISTSSPRHAKNSFASPTPILAGDRVYVHFGAEGTAALNTKGDDPLEDAPELRSRSTAPAARPCCTTIS